MTDDPRGKQAPGITVKIADDPRGEAKPAAPAPQADPAAAKLATAAVHKIKAAEGSEPPRLDINPGDVTWDPPLLICL